MSDKTDRDQVLDELAEATKEWHTKRRQRLEGQVTLAKNILRGRNGSQRLQNVTVQQASALVVDEIEAFLTGNR